MFAKEREMYYNAKGVALIKSHPFCLLFVINFYYSLLTQNNG